MEFIKGQKYGKWTFIELLETKNGALCQLCDRNRTKLYRFDLLNEHEELIAWTELGTECVKNFDFNQNNPYTNKKGVNTSL